MRLIPLTNRLILCKVILNDKYQKMIRFTFLILAITLIVSCKTKQSEDQISNVDSSTVTTKADTSNIDSDSHFFWTSELDQENGLVMKRTIPATKDLLTAPHIINMLNEFYPEIKLSFIKLSNDSIFVRITDNTYLTQQMGSSGAQAYLAEVTYNLTELNGINFVQIRFKEGIHA